MSEEVDAAIVRAEVVALQAIMLSVFRRLAADRPELRPVLCDAFNEAETILSGVAVKMGLEDPARSTLDALRIVEEFRAAVIRDETICR